MKLIYLTDSIHNPLTGIGRYAYELGIRLENHLSIEKILYFHRLKNIKNINKLLDDNKFIDYTRQRASKNSFLRRYLRTPYISLQKYFFEKIYKQNSDYIVHTPSFFLPSLSTKFISTIHDLSHKAFPEFHPKERVEYLNKNFIKTLENAEHIITVSNFSKNELIKYYQFDPTKITVIPLGVSNQFRPHTTDEIKTMLKSLNLEQNSYLLSVATLEPRKNLFRLIEAYTMLPKLLKKRYPLVLAGTCGWLSADLNNKIKAMISENNIKVLGYVCHTDLPALYAGARGVVYPSVYEGFGFQVLEAMASGVPILTSAGTSMEEISGKLALLIDPFQVASIKNGLEQLLEDQMWHIRAQTLALQHAAQYTWEKCTSATVDVYKQVSEKKSL